MVSLILELSTEREREIQGTDTSINPIEPIGQIDVIGRIAAHSMIAFPKSHSRKRPTKYVIASIILDLKPDEKIVG